MLESYFTECKFDMGQSGSTANAKYEFKRSFLQVIILRKIFFCLFMKGS